MRLIAIALLASCGGSAVTPPTTTPTRPEPASTGEDWRGVLSQWVGTWSFASPNAHAQETCSWLGTFVACTDDHAQVSLLGYEPINRRYFMWALDSDKVDTYIGSASPSQWSLHGDTTDISWKRTSPTTWTSTAGVYTASTPPGPPPPAPPAPAPSSVDWHSELQALVGHWTFTGTTAGQPLTYSEDCDWVPASTFVYCTNPTMQRVSLTGWEPQNQAFAMYGFAGGQTHRLPGTVENHNWTFTDGKATLTMARKSPLEFELRGTAPTGETFEGSYSTKPE